MTQRQNVVLVVAVSIVLSCALASIVYTVLPENVQEPSMSTLENRTYQTLPDAERKTLFLTGQLQLQADQYIADRIPFRDDVLLLNASIQRAFIKMANIPFNYSAFHTYYGSNRVAIPSLKAIYRQPASNELYPDSFFDLVGQFCNGVIGGGTIQWFYYLPDSTEISEANPAHNLVANPMDYSKARQRIIGILPEECLFLEMNYTDPAEYSKKLFHTDHHFQIDGALDFYNSVCKATGKKPVHFHEPRIVYEGPFIGSSARAGLDIGWFDTIQDVAFDMGDTKISYNGKAITYADIDEQYRESEFRQKNRFENVYVTWFHNDAGILEYYNPRLPQESGSLLLISDSYDSSSDRFFSANYCHVYEIDPRHFEGGTDAIRTFIDSHPDIIDAVIVISMDVYIQMEQDGILQR